MIPGKNSGQYGPDSKIVYAILGIMCLLSFLLPGNTRAEVVASGDGRITYLENGWEGEGIALRQTGNAITGCTADGHEFGIEKSNPLFKELTSLAIAAFTSGSVIELMVDKGNCVFGGRTKVISIRLKR